VDTGLGSAGNDLGLTVIALRVIKQTGDLQGTL